MPCPHEIFLPILGWMGILDFSHYHGLYLCHGFNLTLVMCSDRKRKETLGMWDHLGTGVKKSYLLTQETMLLAWKKEFKIDSNRNWRKCSKEGLLKRDLTHNKSELPMRSYWISEQENYMQIPQEYLAYFYALNWKK